MKNIVVSLAVVGAVMFSGCSLKSDLKQDEASVNNVGQYNFDEILKQKEKWKIDTYKVGDKTTFLNYKNSEDFSLSFKEGKVVGKAGCNHFFAEYKIEGNKFEVSHAGMTRMMCEEKLVQIENEIVGNLTNNTSVIEKLNDGGISFKNEKLYLEIK